MTGSDNSFELDNTNSLRQETKKQKNKKTKKKFIRFFLKLSSAHESVPFFMMTCMGIAGMSLLQSNKKKNCVFD